MDHGVEEDLIIHAFEKAAMKNAPYNYAQTILREWMNQGIKTMEEGKAEAEARKSGVIKKEEAE